jgi:hypothetical protein
MRCQSSLTPTPNTHLKPLPAFAYSQIGQGKDTFQRAKKLVSSWGHFQLGWADVDPATPVKKGAPVCVRANVLGVWLMNPLEVV